MSIIEEFQKSQLKKIPKFRVGDTLKVSLKIIEGGRERLQAFSGTLIARKGKGLTETITLRRISYGEGVERILPIHSPRIEKIEIVKMGKVRRAKLYYLRALQGKKAKIQEIKRAIEIETEELAPEQAEVAPKAEEPKKVEEAPKAEEPKKAEEAPKAEEPKKTEEAPKAKDPENKK